MKIKAILESYEEDRIAKIQAYDEEQGQESEEYEDE